MKAPLHFIFWKKLVFSLVLAGVGLFISPVISPVFAQETTVGFEELLAQLTQQSFKKKTAAVEAISQLDDERTLPVMKALLKSELYYVKDSRQVVFAVKKDGKYDLTSVLQAEHLGKANKSKIKKIGINNKLRGILRGAIAVRSLGSKDAGVRLAAVKEMFSDMDADLAQRLRDLIPDEKNSDVREAMQLAVAMVDISSDDRAIRITALNTLGTSLSSEARNPIVSLLQKDEAGNWLEPDAELRAIAKKALEKIDSRLKVYRFVETTFFGLSLGSVLLLIAVGLAITFGVMGVINMAHGELMMIGAYTTYVVQQLMPNYIDVSIFVAIPAAFIVAGLFGIAIERGVIRFLYGRPLETLLATFGISLVLQQLVRSVFSPLNRAVETPSWMSGSLEINSALALTYNRLYIILFALLVFIGLLMVLKKTSLGLQVRAVSQNRDMAKALGVRTEWVDAMTFGLGAGIAGVAGVALSQLTNVGPNLGQGYIVDSFMVVVFGGVGNLWGTLVGALSLGVVNKYLEPWAGAVLAKILVLIFIILFIQKRPRGLFPQKGRAAEN